MLCAYAGWLIISYKIIIKIFKLAHKKKNTQIETLIYLSFLDNSKRATWLQWTLRSRSKRTSASKAEGREGGVVVGRDTTSRPNPHNRPSLRLINTRCSQDDSVANLEENDNFWGFFSHFKLFQFWYEGRLMKMPIKFFVQ